MPCLYLLVKAFEEAFNNLKFSYGPELEELTWGGIHRWQYKNIPFSMTFLKRFFHRAVEQGGAERTVYVGHYDQNFDGLVSANFRMIVNLDDAEPSWLLIDTGNSGHLLSVNFDDQLKLYHSGQYLEMQQGEKKGFWPVYRITIQKEQDN